MNVWKVAAVIMMCAFIGACSSGSSSGEAGDSTTTANITTLSAIPRATSAVVDGSAASAQVVKLAGSDVGMPLGGVTADDFDENSSMAACEMFNMTKTAINEAAMGDLIFCYVTSMFEAMDTAGVATFDIYDQTIHTLEFVAPEEMQDAPPGKVIFQIIGGNDADGDGTTEPITAFRMLACDDGQPGSLLEMTVENGNEYSLTNYHQGSNVEDWGGGETVTMTYADRAVVTGTLNSDGLFVDEVNGIRTPKTIMMEHTNASPEIGHDWWGVFDVAQTADQISVDATMGGTHVSKDSYGLEEGEEPVTNICISNDTISGVAGLNDDENATGVASYDVGLLELTDGALLGEFSGSCDSGTPGDVSDDGSWQDTFTTAWDGATALTLDDPTTSDYYGLVSGLSISAATKPSIDINAALPTGFSCDNVAEGDIPLEALMAGGGDNPMDSCDALQLGHEHINCWEIIDQSKEDEPGGE